MPAAQDIGDNIDGRVKKAVEMFVSQLGMAERVLDIGCGTGGIALHLQVVLKAGEVFGVDLVEERVSAAQARGVKAIRLDLDQDGDIPLESGHFDAIFCGDIIEHLTDRDRFLDEISRLLTDRGICVLTTPNLAMWVNRFALLLGWQPFATMVSLRHNVGRPVLSQAHGGGGHSLQLFTLKSLRELLALHGFSVTGAYGVGIGEMELGVNALIERPLYKAFAGAVYPIDRLLSMRASLAPELVVSFRKATK